jgi:superfamily II DNA or RNA helicase
MPHSVRLRRWQKQALDCFAASPHPDFLAVATPGAGKTTFALTAALSDLAARAHRRLVVVAPTAHLKLQWAQAAARFGLHLEPEWSARTGWAGDMHGVVVTYQQVAAAPAALRSLASSSFVVFDEIHHAGDERAWGDSVREAFEGAGRRLAISGTPFRSDTNAIPFVRYDRGQAVADFEYGYGEALRDGGVVRPVYFPRLDGQMEWQAPDGMMRSASFGDRLDRAGAGQRLRTALTLEGDWLAAVLSNADQQLRAIRQRHPNAGGLVIATDQDHARGIARVLRERCGVDAAIATSDDPAASDRIARFAGSDDPWIVAVRMVSEGVDIPRLRVGVFATTTTTELFFRQAVGRLVRWTRGLGRQPSYLFIPDDVRLRTWAFGIAEQRRHSLRNSDDDQTLLDPQPESVPPERDQLSLFTAISAVAIGAPVGLLGEEEAAEARDADDDESLALQLVAPPLPAADTAPAGVSRAEHKKQLRAGNAAKARALAQLTGRSHREVNAELNRLAGVRSINDATVTQLERRLEHADRWLRRL